jgi:hypothetical protein
LTKIANFRGNFREHFRENAKSVIFTTCFNFLRTFCQLFYFKMPTLVNSIQSDAPFTKYSTSIMIPLLASIFVQKFLHLGENFRIFAKIKFSFGPNGNWILTLPHICLFILLKWDVMAKELQHMYHACRITVKCNGFFVFAKRNFVKFRENRPVFAWYSHFRENWKIIFVSTLLILYSDWPGKVWPFRYRLVDLSTFFHIFSSRLKGIHISGWLSFKT